MRRSVITTCLILITVCAFLLNGCKKPVDDGNDIWNTDEKAYVTEIIAMQADAGKNFDTWSKSMDSLASVEKLHQYFLGNPNVLSAQIGSQGISVQFKNGMRGGIVLNTLDGSFPRLKTGVNGLEPGNGRSTLKSVVNIKKMILFDAAYSEFKKYTDVVISQHNANLPRIDYTLQNIYLDADATLDRYTRLSGYGIIELDSHGYAWPHDQRIQEVYMLTGETANVNTKYWADIIKGNILIMLYFVPNQGWANKYFINDKFISGHNDFSKDTVLFYGGFCYSDQGNWTSLQKSFASGAYIGYNWVVIPLYHRIWAINLIYKMSDTTRNPLMNIAQWMADTAVSKTYHQPGGWMTVAVNFTGDSTLTLLPDTTTTVKDIDGNVYHVKKIGKQYWTVENLKTTRLNDGTAIPNVTNGSSWSKLTTMAYCWYNNDPVNKIDYGALYNWFAVDTKKLAPRGWHVATLADWYKMIDPLGGIYYAGSKLKETGTKHWKAPNDKATNSSGFTGLPGGTIYSEIWNNIYFNGKTMGGYFWTSTAHNSEVINFFQLIDTYEVIQPNQMYPQFGMSVRCVRD